MQEKPNVLLLGGPAPLGSREIWVGEVVEWVALPAEDGSGEHGWRRTDTYERTEHGTLQVYAYDGPVDPPTAQ